VIVPMSIHSSARGHYKSLQKRELSFAAHSYSTNNYLASSNLLIPSCPSNELLEGRMFSVLPQIRGTFKSKIEIRNKNEQLILNNYNSASAKVSPITRNLKITQKKINII
jgi:hypothetical protein